jgi:hypothetical protein
MLNPKVVPLPRPKLLNPAAGNAEQPRAFQFNVTWETLLSYAQPVEISDSVPTVVAVVVVPSHALQVVEPPSRPRADEEAAWEMVVPKMVRR